MFLGLRCVIVSVIIVTEVIAWDTKGINACNCITLDECKSTKGLEKPLKPSTVQLLRERQCGFHRGIPKICCQDETVSPAVQSKPSSGRQCDSRDNCTVLRDCTSYMDVISTLEKPLSAPIVSYLRSQQCGFEMGFPKVCCSELPKNIKSVKSSRAQNKRRFNRLNALDPSETTEVSKVVRATTPRTTTRRVTATTTRPTTMTTRSTSTTPRPTLRKKDRNKKKNMDDAFGQFFFDYVEGFDLFLRQKRNQPDNFLDIEIR
ncbi:unnamed protein product [Acanthoscelides obtectus]|uniref:Clip domain-containing protein n=1 Tax=Acanthoscelides obtectus TaxID=200917 RepID=A0A9P0JXL8_ACAOB|nr:unnamed protein product [Acanthoscelides obtectus]CAK1664007.1 hypothetical protein AOBTE_LOCUS23998 [Acanthoscelides obtectus]